MSNQKWNNEKMLQLSLRMPKATSGRPYLYSIIVLYYNIVILYLYLYSIIVLYYNIVILYLYIIL